MGSDAIDWGAAQRIGEMIAGAPPRGGVQAASIEPLAYDFARRVSDYTGLELPAELPPLEVVDRPAWIAANLKTMKPLLDPLTAATVTALVDGQPLPPLTSALAPA